MSFLTAIVQIYERFCFCSSSYSDCCHNSTKNAKLLLHIIHQIEATKTPVIFPKYYAAKKKKECDFLDCDYPTFRCISCELGSNKQVASFANRKQAAAAQKWQKTCETRTKEFGKHQQPNVQLKISSIHCMQNSISPKCLFWETNNGFLVTSKYSNKCDNSWPSPPLGSS